MKQISRWLMGWFLVATLLSPVQAQLINPGGTAGSNAVTQLQFSTAISQLWQAVNARLIASNGVAVWAVNATNALVSAEASHATNATLATWAVDSTNALLAAEASHSTNATLATWAVDSTNALWATWASSATNALLAVWAADATNALLAAEAAHATNSMWATWASDATNALLAAWSASSTNALLSLSSGEATNIVGPVASFVSNTQTGSLPFSVNFTNLTSGSYVTNYVWVLGDGTVTNMPDRSVLTYSYLSEATNDVTLIGQGLFGVTTNAKPGYIVVLPAP